MKSTDIRNQKVNVNLKDVLNIQSEYIRLYNEAKSQEQKVSFASAHDRILYVRGMLKVIDMLGLPIDVKSI